MVHRDGIWTKKDNATSQLDQTGQYHKKLKHDEDGRSCDILYVSLCPSLITGVLSPVVSGRVWHLSLDVRGGMCCLVAPWSVAGCGVSESTEY